MNPVEKQLLLPALIDERARLQPNRLYCAYLESLDTNANLRQVTYKEFANAVNKCAHWLTDQLGVGRDFETIAYYGPADIRPAIVTLAATKTNRKAFLASPRNSVPAQLKLLEQTHCDVLLVAENFPTFTPVISALAAERAVKVLRFGNLQYWLEGEAAPLYSFEARLHENPQRPFVVLHTSGSTGFPKPIIYTFDALISYVSQANPAELIPNGPPTQPEALKGTCHYIGLPSFHMVGLICLTAVAVYWDMPPILGPSNSISTAEIATKIHSYPICRGSTIAPSVLEDIARDPTKLAALDTLKHVNWIGGPLSSSAIGDTIRAHVNIYCAYGATEFGNIPLTLESQDDFTFLGFSALAGASFRSYTSTDGNSPSNGNGDDDPLFELVLVKHSDVVSAQLVFLNNPTLTEYPTKDLFSPHPTKPHLWRFRARTDDLINTAHGQLIDPFAMEAVLSRDPKVSAALLVGNGRRETLWLVEAHQPPESRHEEAKLQDEIWDSVRKANEVGPTFARVEKEAVIFTRKGRGMLRAGKGTVQRKLTIKLYETEIDALYAGLEVGGRMRRWDGVGHDNQ